MKDWLPAIITIAALSLVQGLLGPLAAIWLGTVVLAFCIGAFWGAGDARQSHREDLEHLREVAEEAGQ